MERRTGHVTDVGRDCITESDIAHKSQSKTVAIFCQRRAGRQQDFVQSMLTIHKSTDLAVNEVARYMVSFCGLMQNRAKERAHSTVKLTATMNTLGQLRRFCYHLVAAIY
jgi:hypothetical protein